MVREKACCRLRRDACQHAFYVRICVVRSKHERDPYTHRVERLNRLE
ncbi:hypothetical protein Thivi_2820 [Thiocystis violascens DSM 198]|uniref:Uncharacterized protein n=1 Tax=Thiocystis violascens (strain ATCC 17096 / DSM 198 / 6111) TaxID=765911 RepID=I3YCL8_THIV6|nr:hypothetical protein Thivi_2820 [Thiocystis violascens DSM 198]